MYTSFLIQFGKIRFCPYKLNLTACKLVNQCTQFKKALAQGSLSSLGILAIIAVGMGYSGLLIVRCFQSVPESLQTYHGVGFRALDSTFKYHGKPLQLGPIGHWMITLGVFLEFLGAMCMVIIFIWENTSYLLPNVKFFYIALVASGAVLPTCW